MTRPPRHVTISVGGKDAGSTSVLTESCHPNRLGHSSGYKALVAGLLVG